MLTKNNNSPLKPYGLIFIHEKNSMVFVGSSSGISYFEMENGSFYGLIFTISSVNTHIKKASKARKHLIVSNLLIGDFGKKSALFNFGCSSQFYQT